MHERAPLQGEAQSNAARSRLAQQLFSGGQRSSLRQLIVAKELLDAPLALRSTGI
jgi:hypothetical protein